MRRGHLVSAGLGLRQEGAGLRDQRCGPDDGLQQDHGLLRPTGGERCAGVGELWRDLLGLLGFGQPRGGVAVLGRHLGDLAQQRDGPRPVAGPERDQALIVEGSELSRLLGLAHLYPQHGHIPIAGGLGSEPVEVSGCLAPALVGERLARRGVEASMLARLPHTLEPLGGLGGAQSVGLLEPLGRFREALGRQGCFRLAQEVVDLLRLPLLALTPKRLVGLVEQPQGLGIDRIQLKNLATQADHALPVAFCQRQ